MKVFVRKVMRFTVYFATKCTDRVSYAMKFKKNLGKSPRKIVGKNCIFQIKQSRFVK